MQELELALLDAKLAAVLMDEVECKFAPDGGVHTLTCRRGTTKGMTTTYDAIVDASSCCLLDWVGGKMSPAAAFSLATLAGVASTTAVTGPGDVQRFRTALTEVASRAPQFEPLLESLHAHVDALQAPLLAWRDEDGATLLDEWASLASWRDRRVNDVTYLLTPTWDSAPRSIASGTEAASVADVVEAAARLQEHHATRVRKPGQILVRTVQGSPSAGFDNAWLSFAAESLVRAPHVMVAPRSMEAGIRRAFGASVAVVPSSMTEAELEVAVTFLSEGSGTAAHAVKLGRAC